MNDERICNDLRLPDFLGIGPERTGTTWLHEALTAVAGLPRVKETHFFSTRYERGIEWYAAYFRHCRDSAVVGEICPYFGYFEAPRRVRERIPRCKIICTFRDPVDRAYSFYKLLSRWGQIEGDFEQALAVRPEILESGRYAYHLRRWQELFGTQRVMVTIYDDLVADPQSFVNDICDFIGSPRTSLAKRAFGRFAENRIDRLPANPALARFALNTAAVLQVLRAGRAMRLLLRTHLWEYCVGRGESFPPLSPEVRARVRAQLRSEVEALEKMIRRDLSNWKRPPE